MTKPHPLTADREQQIRTLDLLALMDDRSAAVISGHLAALLGEIDRLRAEPATARKLTPNEHSAAWHAIEGTAGEDGADAGTILNAVLDRLGIAPPTAADEMAASLRRNGFKPGGTDAELAGVQATDKEPPAEACGKCKTPFDPTDIRFVDSRARYRETPYCRSCVDRCHDSTDAFHRCVICDS